MIRATMYWNRLRLEVDGHAGYDEKGKDIVCAGVSMMVNALAGVLEDAEMRGRTAASCESADGKAVIWADPNLGNLSEIKAYFRMCVKGLQMTAEAYRGYIEIKEVL